MRGPDAEIAFRLARAMRQLRVEREWSQAELAEKLDVSVGYVGLLERGQRLPALGMLLKIADALGASLDQIVGRIPPTSARDDNEMAALIRGLPEEARAVVEAMLRGLVLNSRVRKRSAKR